MPSFKVGLNRFGHVILNVNDFFEEPALRRSYLILNVRLIIDFYEFKINHFCAVLLLRLIHCLSKKAVRIFVVKLLLLCDFCVVPP